jgi:glycosyltransferase involved in cell wall biosynthesis
MENKLISICIPVHNRGEIFKHCLIEACEASIEFANEVEIVVSDNASEDDLFTIIEDVRLKYHGIDIIYHKNSNNIGMAMNFLKVVDIASGKYCWIIGSDDFIKYDGITTLLDIIKHNIDVNFISCNYDLIFLKELEINNRIDDKYINLHTHLKDNNLLVPHKAPTQSKKVIKLDELIDPIYNNVFLGAIMTGIFKKSLWDSVDKTDVDWKSFNSFESIYPHCYIFANAYIGKKAFYCGKPLVTVGEGTREWSTDNGKTYWESSLPLIYFNVFSDMVESYRKFGLESKQYNKCKKSVGGIVGQLFLPIILRKSIQKKYIKDSEYLNPLSILKMYKLTLSFYKGIIISILKAVRKFISNKQIA